MMKQVVYIDVLLLSNLFLNYLLLLAASLLTRRKPKRLRLLLAASLGALFSLSVFLPEMHLVLSLLFKALSSVLIVLAAFPFISHKQFLRIYACFFLAGFAFAGAMLALWLVFAPHGMVYQNGVVYFDFNFLTLTISAVLCYCIVGLLAHFTRKRVPDNRLYSIEIEHDGVRVVGMALFDTGNDLHESFSGAPVVLAQRDWVQSIIPQQLHPFFAEREPDALQYIAPGSSIRLIPYKTIHGSGVLPAFKAQLVRVKSGDNCTEVHNAYIAVRAKNFANGEYEALLGTVFFEAGISAKSRRVLAGKKRE